MSFLSKVKQITAEALGFMSKQELREKLPEVFKAYEEAYGTRKPDIKIVASDSFSFPPEKYNMGSWHVIYAVLNGKVKHVTVEDYFGKSEKLVPGSMFLDCIKGNLNYCYLYVHPQDASPLIEGGQDLTDEQALVLAIMQGYKSFARESTYYNTKYKHDYKAQMNNPHEYKDVLKSLSDMKLVKINSAGSAMLTKEGKNMAIQAKKIAKEKYNLRLALFF